MIDETEMLKRIDKLFDRIVEEYNKTDSFPIRVQLSRAAVILAVLTALIKDNPDILIKEIKQSYSEEGG